MMKSRFSQNTTQFKTKGDSVVSYGNEFVLINTLMGDKTDKAPSVVVVNKGLEEKMNKSAIVQKLGDEEDKIISQKVVIEELDKNHEGGIK